MTGPSVVAPLSHSVLSSDTEDFDPAAESTQDDPTACNRYLFILIVTDYRKDLQLVIEGVAAA